MTTEIGRDATLSDLHGQLVQALGVLDRAGRYAASAHLLAAIELVEADIEVPPADRLSAEAETPAAVMAKQIVTGFGARAEAVVRSQLNEANGSTMMAWAAVLSRMV